MSPGPSTHPQSPSEVLSDSMSPQVSRPTIHTLAHKQRSSSVNSIGSTHSTTQRSMSIVSLESPRNSIVSVEDNFHKPSRTNSNTSLVSLGGNSPAEFRDSYSMPLRHPKIRSRSACAVLSDEEFSEPESSSRYVRWRRRSSDKVQKPSFISIIKKDFKIRYDTAGKPKPGPAPNSASSRYEDLVSSPLSQSTEPFHAPPTSLLSEDYEPTAKSTSGPSTQKKHRSSSVSHNVFLKKRFLLSKDIQFELMSGQSSSPTASSPINLDTRFPFPTVPSPSPVRDVPNSTTFGPLHNSFSPPNSPSPTPAPPNLHQGPPPVPQNKLLQELNRKWNKAMFSASAGDYVQSIMNVPDIYSSRTIVNRKRERSESTSSTDSLTTNHP